jgi:hypothetical protein
MAMRLDAYAIREDGAFAERTVTVFYAASLIVLMDRSTGSAFRSKPGSGSQKFVSFLLWPKGRRF